MVRMCGPALPVIQDTMKLTTFIGKTGWILTAILVFSLTYTVSAESGHNPVIAGFLNFLLPGMGYGYLGKWWGLLIFQIDITTTVWLFKYQGETNSYQVLFPIYLVLGIHAYYLGIKMPIDPP